MVIIAGFGNPLLDITLQITDNILLQKYNLNEDDHKEIGEDDMKNLLNDIFNMFQNEGIVQSWWKRTEYVKGFQWILNELNSTITFGSIGKDSQGVHLENLLQKSGVKTMYTQYCDESTGTCVALVKGSSRSLVAYVGAAERMDVKDLRSPRYEEALTTVDLIYVEGFFLTKRPKAVEYLQHFSKTHNKLLAFNLSAPYIVQNELESVFSFAKNCDILFGNMREFTEFAKYMESNKGPTDLAINLCQKYPVTTSKYRKIIVITNGPHSVTCVYNEGEVIETPVPKLDQNEIVDTTGAGDAFVAGFLAGFFKDESLVTCLKWGCWSAQQIIKQVGCVIPDISPEYLKDLK